jgi:hypothetical protein
MLNDNRRQRTRTAVEGFLRMDASELAWSGSLDGSAGVDEWPWVDLAQSAESLYERGWLPQAVRVTEYEVRPDEDGGTVMDLTVQATQGYGASEGWTAAESVTLSPSPAPFGGVRWWFICSGCARRRAHLYARGLGSWSCRECLGLTYLSRQRRNWASYRGSGWMAVRRVFDRDGAACKKRARRAIRRRLSRWRASARSKEAIRQAVPVLTRASIAGHTSESR